MWIFRPPLPSVPVSSWEANFPAMVSGKSLEMSPVTV
jgi:hypothetical protein